MANRPECDSLIFDLDGTLWDAAEATAKAWNRVFSTQSEPFPPITPEAVRRVAGLTFEQCIEDLVGQGIDISERLIRQLDEEEKVDVSSTGGEIYPGVEAGLSKLSKQYRLFIVSNCQEWYLKAFLDQTGFGQYFAGSLSHGETGLSKKENIRLVRTRNRLQQPIYIGDTKWDQEAAFFAGTRFMHAAYGFGSLPVPSPAVKSFDELVTLFLSPAGKPEVMIRKLEESELPLAQNFYSEVGYSTPIAEGNLVYAAFADKKIVGQVRLAYEHSHWVLRGMQVLPAYQALGVGTGLLKLLNEDLGDKEVFCMPHGWLKNFYAQIGFEPLERDFPVFLKDRLREGRAKFPKLIIMQRKA